MDAAAFKAWLSGISVLTVSQREQASLVLASSPVAVAPGVEAPSPSVAAGTAASELPDAGDMVALGQCRVARLGCPHCANHEVVRWGQASDLPRYRCKACLRTFNALTKTPLAHLRMKDKWAEQAKAMIDGVSTAKAALRCGVHYTTAFRWRHRFLASLAGDKPKVMTGIVEGDETFILESFKGKRSGMPRKSR